MKQLDNGGPAFPADSECMGAPGISARDYFAAKAMAASLTMKYPLSDIGYSMKNGKSIMENYAICAYEVADAMLAARGAE